MNGTIDFEGNTKKRKTETFNKKKKYIIILFFKVYNIIY